MVSAQSPSAEPPTRLARPAVAPPPLLEEAAAAARAAGISTVQLFTWRDLEASDSGGSEIHADKIASNWAAAGLDVTLLTGAAEGLSRETSRRGYRVVRRGGRFTVFGHAALEALTPRSRRPDALMEVWHGMPFFSPLWARCPHLVFVHHIHDDTWHDLLPGPLGAVGRFLEMRVAPRVYRHSRFVSGSESGREDLVTMLGIDPDKVSVAHHGVDPMFTPGGRKSPDPLVVAVGRLTPIKRVDLLVDTLVAVRRQVPLLRARIVGKGPEQPRLEEQIRRAGAEDWLELAGFVPDEELVETYRSAWLVVSASSREGWNMTLTEAGACGTPAVATDVVGHRDSVWHGTSGLLVEPGDELTNAIVQVLRDPELRRKLQAGALERSGILTWEAAASRTLVALTEAVALRR